MVEAVNGGELASDPTGQGTAPPLTGFVAGGTGRRPWATNPAPTGCTGEEAPIQANRALALEYQGNYGTARGNLDIADLVNDPSANDVRRVLGLRFSEQGKDRLLGKASYVRR
jgi:hypothetical protein